MRIAVKRKMYRISFWKRGIKGDFPSERGMNLDQNLCWKIQKLEIFIARSMTRNRTCRKIGRR